MIFRPNDIYSITNLKTVRFSGAIQVLRNTVVSDYPEKKRYENVRFNIINYRYEGVGECRISRKKALHNS